MPPNLIASFTCPLSHSKIFYIYRGKRNLSIPSEIRLDLLDSPYGWVVLMTTDELAELSKKYDKLAIEFYMEPVVE